MPLAIDEDALNDPSMKVMDIQKPPSKHIPHHEYPKMLFLHPKDKTQEHRHKVVESASEEEAAVKRGYRVKPHVPQPLAEEEELGDDFEFAVENNGGTTGKAEPKGKAPAEPKGKGK